MPDFSTRMYACTTRHWTGLAAAPAREGRALVLHGYALAWPYSGNISVDPRIFQPSDRMHVFPPLHVLTFGQVPPALILQGMVR